MSAFESLESCPAVCSFEVLDHKTWSGGCYLRLQVEFSDRSRLFVREYVDEADRRYSYHWQDEEGKLRSRWDNAAHHRHLETYPSHVHHGSRLEACEPVNLDDVLAFIVANMGSG